MIQKLGVTLPGLMRAPIADAELLCKPIQKGVFCVHRRFRVRFPSSALGSGGTRWRPAWMLHQPSRMHAAHGHLLSALTGFRPHLIIVPLFLLAGVSSSAE